MKIAIYKTKRSPLKRISLEIPEIHCVNVPKTSCGEERKSVFVATVPFERYLFDCIDCKPSCVKVAIAGNL